MSDFSFNKRLNQAAQEHAASLSAWNQGYEQLSSGRFEGIAEELTLDGIQVFHERANQTVLQVGTARPDTIAMAVTADAADGSWFCGHAFRDRRLLALSSQGQFELVASAGMGLLAVCIDTAVVAGFASDIYGSDYELRMPASSVVRSSTSTQADFGALLASAISLARNSPLMLEQPNVRKMLSLSLSDALLHSIGADPVEADLPTRAAARRLIVANARDYMQAHADEAISVPQLCAAIGTSRRALQYAFEDVVGLSPLTYLRVMRLNRVRCDLQGASDGTLGDVAARWGFWHLSKFAADYRQLFGELPSATRARYRAPFRQPADLPNRDNA